MWARLTLRWTIRRVHLVYIHLDVTNDKSETLSLSSFRSSLSAVSKLSLGTGWLGRPEPRSLDAELRFVFSSFTKLPALCLQPPGPKMIAELAQDPPGDSAIPMDSFKNLQKLECSDIDPRALLGWDKLAESLRSLTIKRSGLDDPSTIFIDAVLDDQLRRSGDSSRQRTRKLGRSAARSFHISLLPETVREEEDMELGGSSCCRRRVAVVFGSRSQFITTEMGILEAPLPRRQRIHILPHGHALFTVIRLTPRPFVQFTSRNTFTFATFSSRLPQPIRQYD